MAATKRSTMQILRRAALRLPDTEEGVACEGTSLESRTVKTKNKAFLFLRPTELRLKLGASLKEAVALAVKDPSRIKVGAGGWVHVRIDDATDPVRDLQLWVTESHGLCSGNGGKAPSGKGAPKSKARRGSASR